MAGVFILGLVAITMLLGVMKTVLNLNTGLVLAFALLSFLIMLSIEGVFVSLLLRRKRGSEEAGGATLLQGQATRELDAAQARALPEPASSVTEHTTRTFEPVYNERNPK
jgi:heme A synthase